MSWRKDPYSPREEDTGNRNSNPYLGNATASTQQYNHTNNNNNKTYHHTPASRHHFNTIQFKEGDPQGAAVGGSVNTLFITYDMGRWCSRMKANICRCDAWIDNIWILIKVFVCLLVIYAIWGLFWSFFDMKVRKITAEDHRKMESALIFGIPFHSSEFWAEGIMKIDFEDGVFCCNLLAYNRADVVPPSQRKLVKTKVSIHGILGMDASAVADKLIDIDVDEKDSDDVSVTGCSQRIHDRELFDIVIKTPSSFYVSLRLEDPTLDDGDKTLVERKSLFILKGL